jgi:3'-phosphoadenosine 5'-phosphosulfate sulfotransferase (PAPS reductase)/FAD synthetase
VLKVDVARLAISNDPALSRARVLFLTGERRQESTHRATYAEKERHPCSTRARRVDAWRAILDWPEGDVWEAIRRHGVVPHPAYRLGFGRVSCLTCVFADEDQWASIRELDPARFEVVAGLEEEFVCTIRHGRSVREQAERGMPYPQVYDPALRALGLGEDDPADQVLVDPADWELPAGAFRRGGGPS